MDKVKTKYPSIITEQTIEMLKQDKRGRLVGTKQIVVMDENGEVVKVKGERERSYQTIDGSESGNEQFLKTLRVYLTGLANDDLRAGACNAVIKECRKVLGGLGKT